MSEARPEKLQEVLDTLELFPDRADRIQILISIAERFKGVPESIAKPPFSSDNRVPACESEAYMWAVPRQDGTLDFHFAVENPQGISAKAMAVILEESLSGTPLEQVERVSADVVYEIFGNELSMGKSMGLTSMVSMAQNAAKRLRQARQDGGETAAVH